MLETPRGLTATNSVVRLRPRDRGSSTPPVVDNVGSKGFIRHALTRRRFHGFFAD
jgi:hypothetical protein